MDGYKTVRTAAEAEYEEKRSRFIGSIIPCTTEDEAVAFINRRRSETFGARHNVYAYILRQNNISRYSDDGEPHSTAGMPTLEVLRRQSLTDCCIVTTRYFGGVLLGTGGLVRAYTVAAADAVKAAGIAVMRECVTCTVRCPYSDHSFAERLITDCGGKISDCAFTEAVTLSFSLAAEAFEPLRTKFNDMFCGRIVPEAVGTGYAEI